MRDGVLLYSGGLDSTTVLAWMLKHEYAPHLLTIDYGQRHVSELNAARRVAHHYKIADHRFLTVDLRLYGGSALTSDQPVPKNRAVEGADVPVTYVPARNTIFLSFALAFAEVLNARDIFIGANAVDFSGYPDCRPDFISAFEKVANLGTKIGREGPPLTIHAPLLKLSKAGIIQLGNSLNVDYSLTHSCYDPAADETPCGTCDACQLRAKGFAEVGMRDPALPAN